MRKELVVNIILGILQGMYVWVILPIKPKIDFFKAFEIIFSIKKENGICNVYVSDVSENTYETRHSENTMVKNGGHIL